jgi:multiple sugar transport system permease protein
MLNGLQDDLAMITIAPADSRRPVHEVSKSTRRLSARLTPRGLPWVYMAPALVVLGAMTIGPAIFVLYSAFRSDRILGGSGKFVGLDNFISALTNPSTQHSFFVTIGFVVVVVVLEMMVGFALALPLSGQTRANRFGAAVMLLPFAVTPAAAAIVFKQLLNPNFGWIGYYLGQLGFPKGLDLLSDPSTAWLMLIVLDMWQWTPFIALILMAGLQSLPQEPREAAMVDGASSVQMLWHITLPQMIPFLSIAVVLRAIQAFKTFDSFKILTGGGPGNSTEIINLSIYRIGLQTFNVGLACALGVIFLIILSLLIPQMQRVIGSRANQEESQ